jgi:hypothetical protein
VYVVYTSIPHLMKATSAEHIDLLGGGGAVGVDSGRATGGSGFDFRHGVEIFHSATAFKLVAKPTEALILRNKNGTVKQSLHRPGQPLRVPGG